MPRENILDPQRSSSPVRPTSQETAGFHTSRSRHTHQRSSINEPIEDTNELLDCTTDSMNAQRSSTPVRPT